MKTVIRFVLMDESGPKTRLPPANTEDTVMKSAFSTLLCFLVLGFFLLASTGRAQVSAASSFPRPAEITVSLSGTK